MNIDHCFHTEKDVGMSAVMSYRLTQCLCVFPGNFQVNELRQNVVCSALDHKQTKHLSQKPAHVTCVITPPPLRHLLFPLLSCPASCYLYKTKTKRLLLMTKITRLSFTSLCLYSSLLLPSPQCRPHCRLTLLSVMTASWFTPVMLNVSPDSPSKMVYSSLAFSPRSASVAEIRPISAPGMASSETEKDHIPGRDRRGTFMHWYTSFIA